MNEREKGHQSITDRCGRGLRVPWVMMGVVRQVQNSSNYESRMWKMQ